MREYWPSVALSEPNKFAAPEQRQYIWGVVKDTTIFVKDTTLSSNRTTPEVAVRTISRWYNDVQFSFHSKKVLLENRLY
jgi:hypothetical protein